MTALDASENPLIISEWKLIPKKRKFQNVQRAEHAFQDIVDGNDQIHGKLSQEKRTEELKLFDFWDADYDPEKKDEEESVRIEYAPCRIRDVYKKMTISE